MRYTFAKSVFVICLLAIGHSASSQRYFEGEIVYALTYEKKDSAFDLRSIPLFPGNKVTMLFKNGNWLLLPDGGAFEYVYQDIVNNVYYEKYRGVDTLYFRSSGLDYDMKDSIIRTEQKSKTDTLLGRACNRITFYTTKLKLTMLYHPELAADPNLYRNSAKGFYNIIYPLTKAYYLQSAVETEQMRSWMTATSVTWQQLPDDFFPNLSLYPKVRLK